MTFKSSMRAFLGPAKFERFLKTEVFPKLEDLVDEGQMSEAAFNQYSKLFWIKGSSALDFNLHYLEMPTLTTVQEDGLLAYAKLDIGNDKSLTYFVKQASSKENFEIAVNAQNQLNSFLQGTSYEGRVPEVSFLDEKKRVVVNSFVDGETLKTTLSKMDQGDRLDLVKLAIDDYVGLYKLMNSPEANAKVSRGPLVNRLIQNLVDLWKVEEPKKHTVLDFPEQLSNFTEYFSRRYSSNEKLVSLIDNEIGSFLNDRCKYNIHGESHGHNIIAKLKNNTFKGSYIDWSSVTSNGFPEFDMRKKLVKSDLTFEDEVKAAKYAASKLDNVSGEQDSFKTYVLNRIMQGLYVSEKYFHASSDNLFFNGSREQKHKAMAAVLYTDTTKWMDFAVQEELISQELVDEIHKHAPKQVDNRVKDDLKIRKLVPLSDELYKKFRQEYNPYKLMSQENLDLPIAEVDVIKPKDQLKNMSAKLRTNYLTRIAKMIAIPLIAGVVILGANYLQRQKIMKQEMVVAQEKIIESNKEGLARSYYDIFKRAHNEQLLNLSADLVDPLAATDTLIKNLAIEKGLKPKLIVNMLNNHRVMANLETTLNGIKQPGVVVLDPIGSVESISKYKWLHPMNQIPSVSMIEEISEAMDHLKDCIETYDSLPEERALIGGLFDFYDMRRDSLVYIEKTYFSDSNEGKEFMGDVYDLMRNLVYGAIKGRSYAFDGGIRGVWVPYAPDDFPTYRDFHPLPKDENVVSEYAPGQFKNGPQGWSPGNNLP